MLFRGGQRVDSKSVVEKVKRRQFSQGQPGNFADYKIIINL
jgi:hypothetical protein